MELLFAAYAFVQSGTFDVHLIVALVVGLFAAWVGARGRRGARGAGALGGVLVAYALFEVVTWVGWTLLMGMFLVGALVDAHNGHASGSGLFLGPQLPGLGGCALGLVWTGTGLFAGAVSLGVAVAARHVRTEEARASFFDARYAAMLASTVHHGLWLAIGVPVLANVVGYHAADPLVLPLLGAVASLVPLWRITPVRPPIPDGP